MSPVFASYFEPFFVCQTVSLGDSLFYQFDNGKMAIRSQVVHRSNFSILFRKKVSKH